jgi:hypothetical protein
MDTLRIIIGLVNAITALGLPPAITDKEALRDWCGRLGGVIYAFADLVPGEWDTRVANLLGAVVANDATWDAFYELISAGIDPQQVTASHQVALIADQAELDPVLILQIISMIVELIKNWRK